MCRSKDHGGRRCQNDEALARQNIIQQQLRYTRKYIAAETAGDTEAAERNLRGLERTEERLNTHLEAVNRARQGATTADEYTAVTTASLTDAELAQRRRDLAGDPAAVEAISNIMEWRRTQDGDIEDVVENELDAYYSWGTTPSWEISTNPSETPSRFARRKLSPEQQCKEDYNNYIYNQFLKAENETNGNMVTASGRAKNIDPMDLFRGNTKQAEKYASEELKSWFRRNGRQTFASWRYAYFNRDSDYQASLHVRTTSVWDDAA